MSDYVLVPNTGTEKVAVQQVSDGTNTVDRQETIIADDTTYAARVKVQNGDPGLTDYALTVRDVGDGVSVKHIVAAPSNNAALVKGSAGVVYGWAIYNNAAYPVYVKLYNAVTNPPVPGTTTVFLTVGVQSGTSRELALENGITLGTGIGIAILKGIADSDTTAVAASDCVVELLYK